MQKVNIVFNSDKTITYQEKKTYKYIPELSVGRQSDRIVVPNMPVLVSRPYWPLVSN